MTTLVTRLAFAALLALPMAGGGVALPAMADDPIDFVCYDREIGGGKTEIICEPANLVAEECEKSDPDGEGQECAAVEDQIRPPHMTPGELANAGGGNGGGGSSGVVSRLRS
jgi:hypothetical protein